MEVNPITAEAAAEIQRMAAIVKAACGARITGEKQARPSPPLPQPVFDVAFEGGDLFERIGLSPLWITQPISCGRYTKNGTGLANWERRPRTMQGPGCLCRVLANEWQSGSRRFR